MKLLLLLASFLIVGCNTILGIDPVDPEQVPGTYTLVSIDGVPLPAAYYTDPETGKVFTAVSYTMVLTAAGGGKYTVVERHTMNGSTFDVPATEDPIEWHTDEDQVRVNWGHGSMHFRYDAAKKELYTDPDGHPDLPTWLYRKQP